jgi:hypothetical protein
MTSGKAFPSHEYRFECRHQNRTETYNGFLHSEMGENETGKNE